MLVGGWSFSVYLMQLVFRNLQEIFILYWEYLLGEYISHFSPIPSSKLEP